MISFSFSLLLIQINMAVASPMQVVTSLRWPLTPRMPSPLVISPWTNCKLSSRSVTFHHKADAATFWNDPIHNCYIFKQSGYQFPTFWRHQSHWEVPNETTEQEHLLDLFCTPEIATWYKILVMIEKNRKKGGGMGLCLWLCFRA